MLPYELTKDTPYLALSGELWSVFYEYFNRNWPCYKGFLLYFKFFLMGDKDMFILHGQYHGCWWPGATTRSQDISSHVVDLLFWIILVSVPEGWKSHSFSFLWNIYNVTQMLPVRVRVLHVYCFVDGQALCINNLTCWIVLKIIKHAFIFHIISWILFNPIEWDTDSTLI